MLGKRPVPKHRALTPGSIPYGRCKDVDGLIYSIDKFRPRFYSTSNFKADNVIAFFDLMQARYFSDPHMEVRAGEGRVGTTVKWWSFNGLLVSLCKRDSFVKLRSHNEDEDGYMTSKSVTVKDSAQYTLLLEFNPNKHMDSPVLPLIKEKLFEMPGLFWDNTRVDYTLDIECDIKNIRLLSKKSASSYMGTFYFGKRGQSGYTRVYDKTREMAEKYHIDIKRPVTRIEWEVRGKRAVVFDKPYCLGLLGSHEVLRYVPLESWNDALRTYDPRTQRKIKKECLLEYPFDPSVFDDMYHELVCDLGLDQIPTLEPVLPAEVEDEDFAYLERLAADLRRFAKIID